MNQFVYVYPNAWNGNVLQDAWIGDPLLEDSWDVAGGLDDVITPYYRPDAQLIDPTGRGTIATQIVGGSKPSTYGLLVNGAHVNYNVDAYGNVWDYECPLWFGYNPLLITFYPLVEGYGATYSIEEDIFLERVYVPNQPNVTILDGYGYTEGTYYQTEGYGANPDAYGSTNVLFACAKVNNDAYGPTLDVKYITNRSLSSGVIVNGIERPGYIGSKKYFGEGPLFDDHETSKVMFDDGYEHYYTIRTSGLGDGYGAFRDPLRQYGPEGYGYSSIDGYGFGVKQINVYDEAENQVFAIEHVRNDRLYIAEGTTLIPLQAVPDNLSTIQIYREYDFVTRISAATPVAFDPTRNVLTITPFDADGYGATWTRIAYTVAGLETFSGPNDDLIAVNTLQFDFQTSLKKSTYLNTVQVERNYTDLVGKITDHKMHMYFFKRNEFHIEMQLNPGFNILHPEKFAGFGNSWNPAYYDNGKREIVVRVDYTGS